VRLTVTVPAPRFRAAARDSSVQDVAIAGYGMGGAENGGTALPGRILLVAVPPLGDVRLTAAASEAVVHDGVTLAVFPGAPPEVTARARRQFRASPAEPAPQPGARLLDVTWMRNQRVARVLVTPAAYDAGAHRLTVAGRVDVELAVATLGELGPPAEPQDPFEPIYTSSIVNYEQGRGWRRPRTDMLVAAAKRTGTSLRSLAALIVPPDTSVYVGRTWIKIAIQKTGFYAVNFSRLRGLSLFSDANPTPLDSLRLFTWPGRTVLPENTYCDSCDYQEVAIGFPRDVSAGGAPDTLFSTNDDTFYFFAQGPNGWESDMDSSRPDTSYIDHQYENNNFYYLTVATAGKPVTTVKYPHPPLRIAVGPGVRDVAVAGGETPVATVPGRLHLEQDNPAEYWPDATSVGTTLPWEKFFWQSLTQGQSPIVTKFDLPDADITQPARFRARIWGLSDVNFNPENPLGCVPTLPDHILDVSFNSVNFIRTAFFGQRAQSGGARTFDTTGVVLRNTANTLTIAVPAIPDPGCAVRVDRDGLAFQEVYYRRLLLPDNDAIDFRTNGAAGRFLYSVGPFVKKPSTSFLFDVTNPLQPVLLQSAVTDTIPAGGYSLTFADSQSVSHRYVVVPDSILTDNRALIAPGSLSDAPFTSTENLRSPNEAADYLVIYFDGFKTAADSLLAWRQNHLPLVPTPAVVKGVPISAVYDQFSGGRTDPGAIRDFLRAATAWSRRPLYVVFLGDASFDFKDLTGRAIAGQPGCLLPSFENNFDGSPFILRQFATDDWLVNVNDPVVVLPDYLSGRIPADDASSALDVVVQKILGYERHAPFGEYRSSVIFMADDDSKGLNDPDPIAWGHIRQTDELNIDHTPLEVDRDYVYLHTFPTGPASTKPGARLALEKDLDAGTSLFNFVGHGSPFKMTDEGVFLDSDAGTLTNGLKMPLMVSASCDVGKFNDPAVQSLGEKMFMQVNGGCIGVISATEQAISNANADLNDLLYDVLFLRDTTTIAGRFLDSNGQYHMPPSAALLASKSRQFGASINDEKFQLMGDPATELNLPRLWGDIQLRDVNNQPVTQITRGQTVRFTGRVLDRPGGSLVPIDGSASMLIEDSAPTNLTPKSDGGDVASFRFSAGPMYHGDVTLKGGAFSGQFIVPADATVGTAGRVRAYVAGGTGGGPVTIDGAGYVAVDIEPGTVPTTDVTGPRITLSFQGGATNVHSDATLQIGLFDESGIMTTAHAPQNSIIVTVDDNTTTRADVTSTFRCAADSYQSGTASFQLPNLSPGAHTIKVSAADNLATGLSAGLHRSSATIDFAVSESPPLRIERTYLFPDPVRSRGGAGAGGVFVVDAPGDPINTLIRIYTVAGKLVRSLELLGGQGQIQVPWDGRDDEGDGLAQGTYLYKVYVNARDADGKSSPRQKATAMGRFVVLNPK
jgi:hypothetical protein